MNVILSHDSAFEFWMMQTTRSHNTWTPTRASVLDKATCAPETVLAAASLDGCLSSGRAVHVLIPDVNARRRNESIAAHVQKAALPAGSFVKVTKTLYVSSPALTLAQLGNKLSFGNLMKAALWLCGSFSLEPGTGRLQRCAPVAHVTALRSYLEKARGLHGVGSAAVAARYALDGCLSPRESDLATLLFAPKMRGGYGFKNAVLNQVVEVPAPQRALVGQDTFECDVYWPDARVDLEYDSDEHHAEESRRAHDFRRTTKLALMDIDVVHATNGQVKSYEAFEALVEGLSRRLKIRHRPEHPEALARKSALRQELFGQGRWEGFSL